AIWCSIPSQGRRYGPPTRLDTWAHGRPFGMMGIWSSIKRRGAATANRTTNRSGRATPVVTDYRRWRSNCSTSQFYQSTIARSAASIYAPKTVQGDSRKENIMNVAWIFEIWGSGNFTESVGLGINSNYRHFVETYLTKKSGDDYSHAYISMVCVLGSV